MNYFTSPISRLTLKIDSLLQCPITFFVVIKSPKRSFHVLSYSTCLWSGLLLLKFCTSPDCESFENGSTILLKLFCLKLWIFCTWILALGAYGHVAHGSLIFEYLHLYSDLFYLWVVNILYLKFVNLLYLNTCVLLQLHATKSPGRGRPSLLVRLACLAFAGFYASPPECSFSSSPSLSSMSSPSS